MSSQATADLLVEVRRLRTRLISLTERAWDEVPAPEVGLSREDLVRQALSEFSARASGGREVPNLGRAALSDQVSVLLLEGLREDNAHAVEPLLAAARQLRARL